MRTRNLYINFTLLILAVTVVRMSPLLLNIGRTPDKGEERGIIGVIPQAFAHNEPEPTPGPCSGPTCVSVPRDENESTLCVDTGNIGFI